MKYLLILLILIFSNYSYSQEGTVIIATVTNNEIIIAADSRGVYYETDNRNVPPIAYYDSARKIFKLKQFTLGICGAGSIGKLFYQYYN